jgi:hypothetical protein
MKDQMKQPAPAVLLEKELLFPKSVYSQKNVAGNIRIAADTGQLNAIIDWGVGK